MEDSAESVHRTVVSAPDGLWRMPLHCQSLQTQNPSICIASIEHVQYKSGKITWSHQCGRVVYSSELTSESKLEQRKTRKANKIYS